MNLNVLEIRNYLFKENMAEHFIDYFEANLIFSLQDANMPILGQFRLNGEPERFVFIRGFSDMAARLAALRDYYSGPVWEKWGAVANEMMLEWHNVHLLRPLGSTDLTCGLNADSMSADLAEGTISPYVGVVGIDFYEAQSGKRAGLIEAFQSNVVPAYEREAIQVRGLLVAEMSENEYPRLPAIQNEDELVVVTAYESEDAYRQKRAKLMPFVNETIGMFLTQSPETLLLNPTLRSPLRYLPLK